MVTPTTPSTPAAEQPAHRDVLRSGGIRSCPGQLDPEDLREVVRAYQQVCSAVITQFDGHIAQLLGWTPRVLGI